MGRKKAVESAAAPKATAREVRGEAQRTRKTSLWGVKIGDATRYIRAATGREARLFALGGISVNKLGAEQILGLGISAKDVEDVDSDALGM